MSITKTMHINRRQFLLSTAALAASLRSSGVRSEKFYSGPYLLRIHASGGWDLSQYCDPKVNQPHIEPITNWSDEQDIKWSGNIAFAPVANNNATFDALASRMLVINGVDTQTNAHQTGERHTWTGASGEGRPSITALFAAANGADLPLPMLNFGGFSATAGIIRPSIAHPGSIKGLTAQRSTEESELLERYRARGLDLVTEREYRSPWAQRKISNYRLSNQSKMQLDELHSLLPDQLENPDGTHDGSSNLKAEIQVSLLAFKSGLTASAECSAGGNWDTHGDGEFSQLLNITALNNGLTYLWELAESLGIAKDLTVIVSSDFGRTPWYNSYGGKDHWPINSYLIMANNPAWGGRVVGHTDEMQNASHISPSSLQRTSSGTLIYPKHVHHALHQYLGISEFAKETGFDFKDTELFDFFNPKLST